MKELTNRPDSWEISLWRVAGSLDLLALTSGPHNTQTVHHRHEILLIGILPLGYDELIRQRVPVPGTTLKGVFPMVSPLEELSLHDSVIWICCRLDPASFV